MKRLKGWCEPSKFWPSYRMMFCRMTAAILYAKAAGLILVTDNEREFRRIDGLEIQNWAD